jgi:hypothetical protein
MSAAEHRYPRISWGNKTPRDGVAVSFFGGRPFVLALCDEVFRGTNIKDATQATGLLVDGLARAPSGTFVIASHLAEVAEARTTSAGVGCWCMEVESTGVPTFSYRVRRGASDVHLGMVLLDAEGLDRCFVEWPRSDTPLNASPTPP